MKQLISQYIDNELSLDEKVDFVTLVQESRETREHVIALLAQEKMLRKVMAPPAAEQRFAPWWKINLRALAPKVAGFAAATALLLFIALWPHILPRQQQADLSTPPLIPHRFVFFNTKITQAEVSGTFTNWRTVPMQAMGAKGYWEVTLPITPGEHRYVFIIDGQKQIADPTTPVRESDDFGASNSILFVEA